MEILIGIVCLALGAGGATVAMRSAKQGSLREADAAIESARTQADQMIGDAQRQAETLKKEALLEAKEEILQSKQAAEAEEKQRKKELRTMENRIMQREERARSTASSMAAGGYPMRASLSRASLSPWSR